MSTHSTNDDAWTVLRLLQWTTEFFQKKASDSPRLDAEILLAHARGCSRIELYTSFAAVLTEEQITAFRELVRRRGEGMPVAQLVGYKEFYSLKFRVNEHVLVPRPETEHLVIEALDRAKEMKIVDRPLRIADIGTGSGAIAIALAKHLPTAELVAVDQSRDALAIARWNAEQHGVESRVEFLESDLLSAVESPDPFDIVCSNPPYVSQSEYDELSPTVRDYEPRTALVAGPLGSEVIERIIRETPARIVGGGRLILELSPMIAAACEQIANTSDAFGDARFIKDLDGHQRILSLSRL
jgi:release factor glutamine methyltransferase